MFVLLFGLICLHGAFAISFDGDTVLRVTPHNSEEVEILQRLQLEEPTLDFWTEPHSIGRTVDIHLKADEKEDFIRHFGNLGLDSETYISDIGDLIRKEKRNSKAEWSNWTAYEELENIEAFLVDIASQYDFVSLDSIGRSYEDRDIWVMRIHKSGTEGQQTALIDFNIHAREWITSAVGTWIINELLTNPDYDAFLNQWDLRIIAVLNPDGLKFTKTNNRLWRKTRSDTDSIFGCKGVDPNRNWDKSFAGPGTSNDKCSEIYHGPSAFSEPETLAASQYIQAMSPVPTLYLSVHSYSQLVLLPYGDTTTEPEDYDEMKDVGQMAEIAIEGVHGTDFETDTIPNLLALASGGSIDWTKDAAGIKWSYAFELRDKGQFGFLLPAEQIIPSGEETIAGVVALLNAVSESKS